MKSLTQEAADKIDHMIELLHQQIDTYRQLQKGLLLADLLGVPPKEIKEPLHTRYINLSSSVFTPWKKTVLAVRVGDGPTQEFKLKDIDQRLWPEDLRQAYARWQKTSRRPT